MHNTIIKVRISNPNRERDVEVQHFDNLMEAFETLGQEKMLQIINDHISRKAREQARIRMIGLVMRGEN